MRLKVERVDLNLLVCWLGIQQRLEVILLASRTLHFSGHDPIAENGRTNGISPLW